MSKIASLLIVAALGSTPAFAEGYNGTLTGPNGGTAAFTGSCSAGEGQIRCERDTLLTGPGGHTATRETERVWTRAKVSTKVVTTGEGGRSITTTRERLR